MACLLTQPVPPGVPSARGLRKPASGVSSAFNSSLNSLSTAGKKEVASNPTRPLHFLNLPVPPIPSPSTPLADSPFPSLPAPLIGSELVGSLTDLPRRRLSGSSRRQSRPRLSPVARREWNCEAICQQTIFHLLSHGRAGFGHQASQQAGVAVGAVFTLLRPLRMRQLLLASWPSRASWSFRIALWYHWVG